jgi:uncharacterized protein (TIGR02246 family)
MAPDAKQHSQEEIRQILRTINDAWTHGRSEDLAEYFHDDLVIVNPGFQGRLLGRQASVESYQDFAHQATIGRYAETEIAVDVWGDTAVASYRYEIDYELGGEAYHDIGRDLFVFQLEEGRWRAVWRTLIPQSPGE